MTSEEVLAHNKTISAEIKKHKKLIVELRKMIKPPCEFCPYDGLFRCDACRNSEYEGFNVKDY